MKNIPNKIYLNLGTISETECNDTEDFHELSEVTWCEDKVDEFDIEYVRSKWIDASEELPKDGQAVLAVNKAMLPAAFVSRYIEDGKGLVIDIKNEQGEVLLQVPVTHWLPLPSDKIE